MKTSEKEKYMLVKTLILANPVIGKITNMSGINTIVNKLEHYSDNDLTDYMKNRYKYINIVIRELLATEITNDVCKELLYHNIDPIFFDYADDFRITDITHKIIDNYNMNTIVETSFLLNDKIK